MEGQGEARWSFRNFLEIFPFVGHINFEGDRRRCTENISRRQCHGSSRIPSSAIPKMDKPGGEGFDRERVIYHEGLARETFQKTYRERGKEGGRRRLRSPSYVSSILHQIGGEKGERGWKPTHEETSKGLNFIFLPG